MPTDVRQQCPERLVEIRANGEHFEIGRRMITWSSAGRIERHWSRSFPPRHERTRDRLTLATVWLFVFGLLLCGVGALVARYGYGEMTRDDWNGMRPSSWKLVGGAVAAIGVAVVLIGTVTQH